MSRRTIAAALLASALLTGCGVHRGAASSSPTAHVPVPSLTPASPSATSTATPAVPHVSVIAAGAAAGPSGTEGVAVIRNDFGGGSVTGVAVTITALSSNSKPPVQATVRLAGLAAGEEQAVVTPLALPADFAVAGVSATAALSGTGAYANPYSASGPVFGVSDMQPTVTVTVAGAGTAPGQAEVTAVCYTASGAVLGGGAAALSLRPGESTTASVPVALRDTPDHCDAWARPA